MSSIPCSFSGFDPGREAERLAAVWPGASAGDRAILERKIAAYEKQAAFYAAQAVVPHTYEAADYFRRLAAEARAALKAAEGR